MNRDSTYCRDPALALQSEWIETNACGGYAASTLLNAHTRKYHGLLVAALRDPPGRFVLLSKLDDVLLAGERELPLSLHLYNRCRVPPDGDLCLDGFTQDESPAWRFRAGEIELEKRVLLLHKRNTVLIGYRLVSAPPIPLRLRLRPLLAYRGIHDLQRENDYLNADVDRAHGGFRIQPFQGMPTLYVRTSGAADIHPEPLWYRRFDYPRERERGFPDREDLFSPATITVALPPEGWLIVAAGIDGDEDSLLAAWDAELARRGAEAARTRAAVVAAVGPASPQADRLAALMTAGDRFFFQAPDGRTSLIAGFPWFDDWSRDTLIALPGLMLASGRTGEALAILKGIAARERNGMLPNFFAADPARHAYNSADASLWFFRAVQQIIDAGLLMDTVRAELWPVMRRIVTAYRQGADPAIGTDETGMLFAGGPETQLTWMDATVNGRPVTARHGAAVELNALWYNALVFARELAQAFNEPLPFDADLPERLRDVFRRRFWLPSEEYLADVWRPDAVDTSVRPNQILAVALPHSPLTNAQQTAVVLRVQRELFTPRGLRTLSPRDHAYRGRYEGDGAARDGAYHQGTVWPWLLGPFCDAFLRVNPHRRQAARMLEEAIAPLLDFAIEGPGLGNFPELFDGDPPQRPAGCFAQAWSSGELIRVLIALARAQGA